MKIALGTLSESKRAILKKALSKLNLHAVIEQFDTNSDITDQPLSEDVTKKGAVNRAKNAIAKSKNADIGMGLEGGLDKYGGDNFYLICVAAIIDTKGKVSLGISEKIKLPQEVSEKVDRRYQFGQVIREYAAKNKNSKIKATLDELISRERSFTSAIQKAILTGKFRV